MSIGNHAHVPVQLVPLVSILPPLLLQHPLDIGELCPLLLQHPLDMGEIYLQLPFDTGDLTMQIVHSFPVLHEGDNGRWSKDHKVPVHRGWRAKTAAACGEVETDSLTAMREADIDAMRLHRPQAQGVI